MLVDHVAETTFAGTGINSAIKTLIAALALLLESAAAKLLPSRPPIPSPAASSKAISRASKPWNPTSNTHKQYCSQQPQTGTILSYPAIRGNNHGYAYSHDRGPPRSDVSDAGA
jgi:hypothetical protein